MRASTPGHARLYCTAGFTATPSSLAARKTNCGSRKSSRARETRSALPSANMSFACCGVVIIPTAPTTMSGCAFLTASANGTCEKNGTYYHATNLHPRLSSQPADIDRLVAAMNASPTYCRSPSVISLRVGKPFDQGTLTGPKTTHSRRI
jgi:hypothetical protein